MAWPRVARAQRRAAVVNASDNGVNPARSANSTVTTLRSSCVSGSAVTSATPHPDQNFALCLISASGPEVPEGSGVLLSGGSIRAYFLVTPVRRGRGCSLVRCDRWRSARREAGGGLVGVFPMPAAGGVPLAGGQQGSGARGGRLCAIHSHRVLGVGGDAGVCLPQRRCHSRRAGSAGAAGAGGGPGTDR